MTKNLTSILIFTLLLPPSGNSDKKLLCSKCASTHKGSVLCSLPVMTFCLILNKTLY